MDAAPVAVVFSFQFPGRYALTALAGVAEQCRVAPQLSLHFQRDRTSLLATVDGCLERGQRVAVAWSFYSASFPAAADEARWLRTQLQGGKHARAAAQTLFLAGGVHATAEPEATLRAGFDFAAVGEGERTFTEVLERLVEGTPLHGIRGLAWLDGARAVLPPRAEPVALDDWPPFAVQNRKLGAIEVTRGCIYACRFCQTPFMNRAVFRHRSVDNVARWVSELRAAGKRDVRFITPTSMSYGSSDGSVNLAAVEALLARCREAIGPDGRLFYGTFPSEIRPEHVSPEALALLRRYVANDNVIIGGQSGSNRVLDQTHRGHDVASVVRAVRIADESGFVPHVDFILGLPSETEEEMLATVALMHELTELGAKVHSHTFMPLPGTPYRDASPGHPSAQVLRQLEVLASRGRLYGQWKRQQELARALAERRQPVGER